MADTFFEPEVRRGLRDLKSNIPLAIECKKTMEARLPLDQLKEHQIKALSEFRKNPFFKKLSVPSAVRNPQQEEYQRFHIKTEFDFIYTGPGRSFILVNFRFTKKSPRKDIRKGINRCFAITIEQFLNAKGLMESLRKASISYDWFVLNGLELKRVRFADGYGWDLAPLVIEEVDVAG
jgi:penicillin-binding protein-related factor A (putative recombinase)